MSLSAYEILLKEAEARGWTEVATCLDRATMRYFKVCRDTTGKLHDIKEAQ